MYNNMQANVLPLHTLNSCGGVKRSKQIIFLKVVMLHIKLKEIKHTTICKEKVCPYTQPSTPWLVSKGLNNFFSEVGHIMYIKLKRMKYPTTCGSTVAHR